MNNTGDPRGIELIYIIALVLTGIVVGFAGGLLGVGGCFIMIPVQYWVLTSMGVDPGTSILIAFGTNLAVVLPTAMSGAYGHNKKGAVAWNAAVDDVRLHLPGTSSLICFWPLGANGFEIIASDI